MERRCEERRWTAAGGGSAARASSRPCAESGGALSGGQISANDYVGGRRTAAKDSEGQRRTAARFGGRRLAAKRGKARQRRRSWRVLGRPSGRRRRRRRRGEQRPAALFDDVAVKARFVYAGRRAATKKFEPRQLFVQYLSQYMIRGNCGPFAILPRQDPAFART